MPTFRPFLASCALLLALAAFAPAATLFAEPLRLQRVISDDPLIDQAHVALTPPPVNELQIAAIGPMRPLVPRFNAIWPTQGEITTYFGEVGPFSPRGHSGIDVAAPEGTPVLAMDDGDVLKAYWDKNGYGGLVIIGHPSGYETWYGHLEKFTVDQGERVKRGEQIAKMGSTGLSTGPHLHFEVRQEGQLRDPLEFLKEANLQDANW